MIHDVSRNVCLFTSSRLDRCSQFLQVSQSADERERARVGARARERGREVKPQYVSNKFEMHKELIHSAVSDNVMYTTTGGEERNMTSIHVSKP